MSQTYYTIVTNLGAALLAQATTLGTKLKLTHLAVGDGNDSLPFPSVAQKKLINEKRRGAINAIYVDSENANHIVIEQVIPPEEGGFYIREIGLFDDSDNLIAVGNCPPSYKPVLSEGSGRTQVINMVIMVDNTGSVELKIDASTVLATRKYVDDLILSKMTEHEKSINHQDASTTKKGFVQLNSSINNTLENQAATPKAVKIAYDLANIAKSTAETDASATVKGRVQLNSAVNSTVENQAATPKAVKEVYDLANGRLPINDGGTVRGATNFTGKLQQAGSDVITTKTIPNYQGLGVGQKWQNVTSSRKIGVTYTNRTGKPIAVSIWQSDAPSNTSNIQAYVDGLLIGHMDPAVGGITLFFIVPNNSTYKILGWTCYSWNSCWSELR